MKLKKIKINHLEHLKYCHMHIHTQINKLILLFIRGGSMYEIKYISLSENVDSFTIHLKDKIIMYINFKTKKRSLPTR